LTSFYRLAIVMCPFLRTGHKNLSASYPDPPVFIVFLSFLIVSDRDPCFYRIPIIFLSYSYRIPIGFLDMKTVPRFSNIEATRFLRNFWSKKLTDRW